MGSARLMTCYQGVRHEKITIIVMIHRDCCVILAECASDFSVDYCAFTCLINYQRGQLQV